MIHRDAHSEGFTMITNDVLRNTTLSDGALRLLVYMLSMAEDWTFSVRSLAATFGVTKDTITARVMELKAAGYLTTRTVINERGQFKASVWDLYESPRPTFTGHGSSRTRLEPDTVPTGHGSNRTRKNSDNKKTIYKEDQIDKKTKRKD